MRAIFVILLLSILISCKDRSAHEVAPEEVVDIPESFVSFYEQFHQDSVYQIEHIVFPVAGKSDSTKWDKQSWKLHKPFNDFGGTYVRSFDNFAGIITEHIHDTQGTVSILRRYAKIGEEYSLIFYSLQTSLEGWEDESN